ncbi:protein NO VEIN domain-containing protein [Prevotella jejuni]
MLSIEDNGKTPRYIEVKTTTGSMDTPFYFSATEMRFYREH